MKQIKITPNQIFHLPYNAKKHLRVTEEFQMRVMAFVEARGLNTAAYKALVVPEQINTLACRGYGTAKAVRRVKRNIIESDNSSISEELISIFNDMSSDKKDEIKERVKKSRKVYDNTPKERFELWK